ncbi:MAG TPA: L-histidine N(alpha)-methyltransferase [Candidatus Baltobacteraceae bacterium]|jgi:dimethylhistidine N-methyltransferase
MTTALVTQRLVVHDDVKRGRGTTFADDVRRGLRALPKRLPPKSFYDDLGSSLFEAITHLPEYYLTRAESELLARYAGDIIDEMGTPIELLELGSGSATKTRYLIEAVLERQRILRYSPIDISSAALNASAQSLIDEYPSLSVEAFAGDYFDLLEGQKLRSHGRTMALFLGSNIGNFEPQEASALLQALRRTLKPGDALLLGTDLKKSIDRLELAYDDPAGVTAAFNKNVLGRINRELGGNFDLRAFEHDAHYDPVRGAVDMFLIATSAQNVRIRDLDMQVGFAEFESIHTESSYKYDPESISRIAESSGYRLVRCWFDSGIDYALSLLSVA